MCSANVKQQQQKTTDTAQQFCKEGKKKTEK